MSENNKIKRVRKSIPTNVSCKLWVKAGGRCEYCNTPLWKDSLTQRQMNKAYISHIVAAQENGPRGHWFWSKELELDLSNLLLLCDECHNRIDESKHLEHSVESLREMKKNHEDRIERMCGYKPENKSHIILMGANIGGVIPSINFESIVNSMLKQGDFPVSDKPICLGIENSEFKDNSNDYWAVNEKQIVSAFNTRVKPLISEIGEASFSVFGLATQPLLVKLGTLFSDLQNVKVYQKHREPDTWDWLERDGANEFIINRPSDTTKKAVLVFALSANAISKRIRERLGDQASIWVITAKFPNNDMLKCEKQLSEFRTLVRSVLDEIRTSTRQTILHIFMAMPVACAIELGRVWMPKADMEMVLYDYNTALDEDVPVITIKNEII